MQHVLRSDTPRKPRYQTIHLQKPHQLRNRSSQHDVQGNSGSLRLRNRLVLPPMASSTAEADGFVTQATLEHYRELGQGASALTMVEYTAVHPSGRSEEHQLMVSRDDHIAGLSRLVQILRASAPFAQTSGEARAVGLQITHCGGKSSERFTNHSLIGPSAVRVPALRDTFPIMTPLPIKEVPHWVSWFRDASRRAVAAGFDVIELHAAHGYGLNQWLSPLTNKRHDAYGGSLSRRFRILAETAEECLAELAPHGRILSVRLPGQDLLQDGLSVADMQWIARELQHLGIGLLDVSSGMGGWRRPPERRRQGYLVEEARSIKAAVSVPVIGVGGITDGATIDEFILNGSLDLAAVGRAQLADAAGWSRSEMPEALTC